MAPTQSQDSTPVLEETFGGEEWQAEIDEAKKARASKKALVKQRPRPAWPRAAMKRSHSASTTLAKVRSTTRTTQTGTPGKS